MPRSPAPHDVVEAEQAMGLGRASIHRAHWAGPIDFMARSGDYHLQLSLLPDSSGRGCFPDRWNPRRFEPIGPLFLTPAKHTLHARSHCRQQRSIVCRFGSEALERWFGGELAWTDRRLEGSLDIVNAPIRWLLLRIGDELQNPGFAAGALVELAAAQIAIELSRQLIRMETASGGGGLAPWRLRLIDDYLAEHATRATLEDLARECRLSVRQLTRAFRDSKGRSVGSYIAETRARAAQERLGSGMSIAAVAAELGFSSPSQFSSAFRRTTGESPKAYKDRLVII